MPNLYLAYLYLLHHLPVTPLCVSSSRCVFHCHISTLCLSQHNISHSYLPLHPISHASPLPLLSLPVSSFLTYLSSHHAFHWYSCFQCKVFRFDWFWKLYDPVKACWEWSYVCRVLLPYMFFLWTLEVKITIVVWMQLLFSSDHGNILFRVKEMLAPLWFWQIGTPDLAVCGWKDGVDYHICGKETCLFKIQ